MPMLNMSAFRGKADIPDPRMTHSGHAGLGRDGRSQGPPFPKSVIALRDFCSPEDVLGIGILTVPKVSPSALWPLGFSSRPN